MLSIENYISAIDKYELLSAVDELLFITVGSGACNLVCTSMCAWYITRVTTKFTKLSSIFFVCFQWWFHSKWLCFTLSLAIGTVQTAHAMGIILIYLGFGAGALFMFCGFVKSIPLEIEEAAMIDGCTRFVHF